MLDSTTAQARRPCPRPRRAANCCETLPIDGRVALRVVRIKKMLIFNKQQRLYQQRRNFVEIIAQSISDSAQYAILDRPGRIALGPA